MRKDVLACMSVLLFITFLCTAAFLSYTSHRTNPSGIDSVKGYTIARGTMVSAFIGSARYTITGYTSPFAVVKLEGEGIFNETIADANGRFTFDNGFAPLTPREVCITAIDVYKRVTQPLCLPAFPIKKDISIGPLILPPTLSINQPEYLISDKGILHGLSTPGSLVDIDLSKESHYQNLHVQTVANDKGEYSMTIPTNKKDIVHVSSRSSFNQLRSIVSTVLTFKILPFWLLFIEFILRALKSLGDNILAIVLFLEGIILMYLIWIFRRSRPVAHPLALRPDHSLENMSDFSNTRPRRSTYSKQTE